MPYESPLEHAPFASGSEETVRNSVLNLQYLGRGLHDLPAVTEFNVGLWILQPSQPHFSSARYVGLVSTAPIGIFNPRNAAPMEVALARPLSSN